MPKQTDPTDPLTELGEFGEFGAMLTTARLAITAGAAISHLLGTPDEPASRDSAEQALDGLTGDDLARIEAGAAALAEVAGRVRAGLRGWIPGAVTPRMEEMTDLHLRRRDRRVLVALLTGAENLSGFPLSTLAQVSAARVYRVLDLLEDAGYVTGRWGEGPPPRRRFYQLTPNGRAWAHGVLGLTPAPENPGGDR